MLHSGSRKLGKTVGDYYNRMAENLNARWFSNVNPKFQLAFLPLRTPEFSQYWAEMEYCIAFALANRKLMMERIQEVIAEALPEAVFEPMINIAHNYAAWENHFGEHVIVHRKGAVHAGEGEIGIIPGSQGTHSYPNFNAKKFFQLFFALIRSEKVSILLIFSCSLFLKRFVIPT